ncbi:hypothetical protein [Paraburkholderia sp.]|uniref:hypothetical protein n=1 Tax=Paraburkholderia sp. TaxID=1926495 RepID=UPI0039E2D517
MSLSVFKMHSVELSCPRPSGARYVICNELHYKACLRKAADLEKAEADTQEFLGIANLNRSEWKENQKLVKSIRQRSWLWFHYIPDGNPDSVGWWVISALLAEVRRGSLLAIKGRCADLFPPPCRTPLTILAARAVNLPDGESMLSSRYALTPLGDALPFEYMPEAMSGDAEYLAGIGSRGDMYACDIISTECKGSVLREFPGQYLNSTLDDIESDAQDGIKDARKALKLLNDGRFKK